MYGAVLESESSAAGLDGQAGGRGKPSVRAIWGADHIATSYGVELMKRRDFIKGSGSAIIVATLPLGKLVPKPALDYGAWFSANYEWMIWWFHNVRYVFGGFEGKQLFMDSTLDQHKKNILRSVIFGRQHSRKVNGKSFNTFSGFLERYKRLPTRKDVVIFEAIQGRWFDELPNDGGLFTECGWILKDA